MPEPPLGIVPPGEVCKNPNRKSILELLEKKPGLTRNQMSEELGLNYKTVAHHFEILTKFEKTVLTESYRGTENLCFRTQDEGLLDEPTAMLYGQEPLRNLALYIVEHPGCTNDKTANALGKTESTLHDQIPLLIEEGLIKRASFRNRNYYVATDILEEWAQTTGQHFERPWKNE